MCQENFAGLKFVKMHLCAGAVVVCKITLDAHGLVKGMLMTPPISDACIDKVCCLYLKTKGGHDTYIALNSNREQA